MAVTSPDLDASGAGSTNETWVRVYEAAKTLGSEGVAALTAALNKPTDGGAGSVWVADAWVSRADLEAARAEIERLEGVITRCDQEIDTLHTDAINANESVQRLTREKEALQKVVEAATRVDVCLYAFQGNEMHIEPDGCLTRLHAALAALDTADAAGKA